MIRRMDLILQIEELRSKLRLKKTHMAREFGVIYQNYNNWIARGSLPKEHYQRAQELLNAHREITGAAKDYAEIFSALSPEAQEVALRQIQALYEMQNVEKK